jgi:hypothetical protein
MKTIITLLIFIWITTLCILAKLKINETKNYDIQEPQQIEKDSTESAVDIPVDTTAQFAIQCFEGRYNVRYYGNNNFTYDNLADAEDCIKRWKEYNVYHNRADSAWRATK